MENVLVLLCNGTAICSDNVSTANPKSSFSISVLNEVCDNSVFNLMILVSHALSFFNASAFIIGLHRLWSFQRYAVVKEEKEKTSRLFYRLTVLGVWVIFVLSSVQLALLYFSNKPAQLVFLWNWCTSVVVWSLMTKIQSQQHLLKFSTDSKFRNYFSTRMFYIVGLFLNSSVFMLQFYLWGSQTANEKTCIWLSLIKSIVLWGLIYISPSHKITDENRNEETEAKTIDIDAKLHNFWKQAKLMKKYMSVSKKSKWCLALCCLSLPIERSLRLYSEIVKKDLLNSISATSSAPTGTDKSVGGLRTELKFRWDLLLIQAILQVIMYNVCTMVKDYFCEILKSELNAENQRKIFRKIQHLSMRWHLEKRCGETLGILRYGPQHLFYFFQHLFLYTIPEWADMIIYIIYVSSVYPRVLNMVIFINTVLIITVHFVINRFKLSNRGEVYKAIDKKLSESIDSLVNYETVKYFTNEGFEEDNFTKALKDLQDKERVRGWLDKVQRTLQGFISHFGTFVGSLLCYWMIFNKEGLSVGDFHLLGSHIFKFYTPLISIGYLHSRFRNVMEDMEKMTSILEEQCEVVDEPDAKELIVSSGEVVFKNVDFSYVPERQILHGVSFTIPTGKTYALVGPTGCGKSTIIRLLFRFYEVTSGSISIDGQNIKQITLNSLRKAIGVIPQDTVLFHQSISNNILYGNLTTQNPEEDVVNAAKCACIHDRIETFPEKYKTIVGSRGLKLSGGERQRVAIARAVLKNAPIMLMDEATSSLDSQTEKQIQNTLESVCKDRTTLIIAHRLSTTINADKILVLNEGRIVESGSHSQLLQLNGMYAKMWSEQISSTDRGS